VTDPAQQPADMIARLGRHWGWLLAYGILTLLAAIAVLAWPGETLLVAAVLFGFQLIVSGIYRFVAAFSIDGESGGARVLLALLGVLSVIVGLWAVRHVLLTLLALTVFLGIFWVVNGFIEIFTALSHRGLPERGWTAVIGVLSVLAGLVVLSYPGLSLLGLATVLGVWLAIFGVMEITAAFRIRRSGHPATPARRLRQRLTG
jgi:uncharacterized membrane protein HdeD (DUF308 family)